MSLGKLCFVTMLAMLVAGRSDRRIQEFDVPNPNVRPYGPRLSADELPWYGCGPTHEPDRSHYVEGIPGGREILPTVFPVQSRDVKGLAAGKLLVASRGLADPNFAQTVILLVRYDAQGVVGLVVNRRTHVPLSRVLDDLKAAKGRSDPIYLGGPVDTRVTFALFHSPARIEGAEQIFSGVYLISARTLFEQTISTRPDPRVFHVYLGYAGWNSDQLRKEVELGAWFIFPADAGTVFNSDPDSLWSEMIRKTELKLAGRKPAKADPWTRAGLFVEVSYKR
ncbi:MAG TPA: YqgE/AlgH family protein [Terriglobales bacterium]|nr:YqgE/AlgH family protein [Terriglobales bacterium]